MADPPASGSPCGHFGRASYDQNKQEWQFNRPTPINNALRKLEEPRIVVAPTAATAIFKRASDGEAGSNRRRDKQVAALVQAVPELQPAHTILPELARISEAVEDATATHDPAIGNLLAVGKIPDRLIGGMVQVVAFPSGLNGDTLRVVQVQKQARGWQDSRYAWISAPTIYGEQATWKGPGVPIQAIDFTHSSKERRTYLVVRLLVESVIFCPILRNAATESSSRLDLNLSHRLLLDSNGTASHAHICPSPWGSGQIAVIDQAGQWNLVKFDLEVKRSAHKIVSGTPLELQEKVGLQPMYDGWARIIWSEVPDWLVICTRTRLLLIDSRYGSLLEFPTVTSHLSSSLGWNLDITVILEGCMALLTTDYLSFWHVGGASTLLTLPKLLACRRHFRNPDDISLRFRVTHEDNGRP